MTRRKWIIDLRKRLRAALGLGSFPWRGAIAGGCAGVYPSEVWAVGIGGVGICAGLVGLGDSGDLPHAPGSSLAGSGFFSPLWG